MPNEHHSGHKVVFLTHRSQRHQQAVLDAAPESCRVVMLPSDAGAEISRELAGASILISERTGVVDAEQIAAAPNLQLIQRLGSLAHDIDLGAARTAGVAVCTWPITRCVMVAEHLVMQMLALAKRLPEAGAIAQRAGDWARPSRRTDENTFAYNWSRRTGIDGLYARTVGILGMGEIGVELARRLRCFGVTQVFYHKRRRLPASVEADLGIAYATREAIAASVDFLCVLLPYSQETDQAINADTFTRMKPGAALVHCGSGSVIDEAALAAALSSGHLGGAALDTFEYEPLTEDNPLAPLARDPAANVLLTPHIAAATRVEGRGAEWTNIRRLLAGETLLHRLV